jgi:hypothetical protein
MNRATLSVIAAVAAAVLVVGVTRPMHNWDMIGYVASAHYQDGLRGEQLLARTYAEVRDEVGPEVFTTLATGDEYRRGVFQSAQALQEQLPFYSIRVVYVWMIRGLGTFGVAYPRATYLVAAFFAAVSVAVLGIICVRALLPVCVLPLVALGTGFLELATFSTPDSLALSGALLATLASMSGSAWVFVLAVLLPALRTEFVIFSALLMLAAFHGGQRLRASIALAASLLVYFAVNLTQHAYGWLTLLNFSRVKAVPYPSKIVPSHDLIVYLKMYLGSVWPLIDSPHFVIYLVAVYLLATFRSAVCTRELHTRELFAIPICFVVIHLLLYPKYEYRQFVLPASLSLVWILSSLRSLALSR